MMLGRKHTGMNCMLQSPYTTCLLMNNPCLLSKKPNKNLPLTILLTASTVNAREMNKAKISSVDLNKIMGNRKDLFNAWNINSIKPLSHTIQKSQLLHICAAKCTHLTFIKFNLFVKSTLRLLLFFKGGGGIKAPDCVQYWEPKISSTTVKEQEIKV